MLDCTWSKDNNNTEVIKHFALKLSFTLFQMLTTFNTNFKQKKNALISKNKINENQESVFSK